MDSLTITSGSKVTQDSSVTQWTQLWLVSQIWLFAPPIKRKNPDDTGPSNSRTRKEPPSHQAVFFVWKSLSGFSSECRHPTDSSIFKKKSLLCFLFDFLSLLFKCGQLSNTVRMSSAIIPHQQLQMIKAIQGCEGISRRGLRPEGCTWASQLASAT